MNDLLESARGNFLSPMVLFFALGLLAGRLRSDLAVPEPISKALSLYLMLAIGFRAGVELAHRGVSEGVLAALLAAVLLSFALPFVAYALLRAATPLDVTNAAAIAAHYGSVSVVTFAAAAAFLQRQGLSHEPHLVVMMALMETPAIVSGLVLARRPERGTRSRRGARPLSPAVWHEIFLGGTIVLLMGSFVIGFVTGEDGMGALKPIVQDPFRGLLAVFMLDLGLLTARRMTGFGPSPRRMAAFGLVMPLVGAALGLAAARLLGLSPGGATLLAVLCASASYIVVPAAMRLALPQANPGYYVTLSLGITFPFNIVVGIPLYHAAARVLGGG